MSGEGARGRGGKPGTGKHGGGARPRSPQAAVSSGQGRRLRRGAATTLVSALTCRSGPGMRPSRPRGSRRPRRSAERGGGWAPAAGYEQRNPLPLPAPAPSSRSSSPDPCSAVPSPPPCPRFPYLLAGARGGGHHERTRGALRRWGPGAGTRSREADPAAFPAQSCHSGGVENGRSWGMARLHLEAPWAGARVSDPSWGRGWSWGRAWGSGGKLLGAGEMEGSSELGLG